MKFKRQDCLGLDWGLKELKWARVQLLTSGRTRLTFLDTLAFPAEEKALLPTLKKYVDEKKLSGLPTAIGLKDESLHIRKLELPRMPEEDLKEAVRWQMRDIAEKTMDDYSIHYSVIKEEAQVEVTRLTLLGYAIKKNVLTQQTVLLRQAGLKPFFVEPTPVSMAAAVERVYPTTENEWVACADIGWQSAYFEIINNGRLNFVHTLAGVALNQTATDQKEYSGKLAMEIQRAMDSFFIAHRTDKIDKLFLAGGGAGNGEMASYLSTNLGVATEILNPLQGMEQTEAFPIAGQKSFLFGPAVGLALIKP